VDWVRQYSLYNLLCWVGAGITPIVPGVALSAEPNEDATMWTLQLRPGVTLHDGSPFTIDDIVYNVANQSANPQPYF
jgi:peptide/nickel transport system substrate-binding protein